MPQVDQVHRRSKNLVIVAVAGSVAVVAAIGGVVFFLASQKPAPSKQTTAAVQNEARDKAFSGDKDAAIELLKAQLIQAKADDEKASINMQLGALYVRKEDYKSALAAYKSAEATIKDFGIYDAIAQTAEKAGDKAMALDYNQRLRAMIKDGRAPYSGNSLPRIEDAIVRLGGKL